MGRKKKDEEGKNEKLKSKKEEVRDEDGLRRGGKRKENIKEGEE
jgi:hypothetical protein